MATVVATNGSFSVKAHRGDAKTLLAFDLGAKAAKKLAGFTIQCKPQGVQPYYLLNNLRFKTPGDHAQDPTEPANSSLNAPIHKFRWLHVPGSAHQGIKPFLGPYTYTVTPRYFDSNDSLTPLDGALSVSLTVAVEGFRTRGLELGFTRGFTQSQAFVHHFGLKALIRPKGKTLIFDTSLESGVNATGEHYSFQDEYEWMGFTAREKVFALVNEVLGDKNLRVDMFAYDLNEPDLIEVLLKLAKAGRIRVILDNAALHHASNGTKPEDQFETLFDKAKTGGADLKRGKFGRYAHDKVFVVYDKTGPSKVLTGSTNFSVTGLYVNSNHVLVFNDPGVAAAYAGVFEEAWQDGVAKAAFANSTWATKVFSFESAATPETAIRFSPHTAAVAASTLAAVTARIAQEGTKGPGIGNVLFAVMEMDGGVSPVYTALQALHKKESILSYGISDNPGGIYLYPVGTKTGVLVTGKPVNTQLPPPFDQVPNVGIGHQIHHKFVVCGFNGPDPVVYCGSSNLALGGEEANGDNLIEIHDSDVATAFAIEALALVDHFNFLDSVAKGPKAKKGNAAPAQKVQAAESAGWFLSTTDKWARKYFDPSDLHSSDRQVFA
jgi:phosphatidylserine/phosphatidylglycerophosphate/cardiolipin synthase-like enzyme